ncbi:MAG: hypothetical protein E7442_05955 [Ruminococcaceae bacterium]|nr:hypothetical protein [Oscillospiraceae bacterium]
MDFNHLKDILSSVVGTVSVKSKEFAEVAVDKTKAAGRVAKASLELTAEKETLKKAYAELGQAYYENCREGAEGVFQQLCEEIGVVNDRIAALEAEVEELKAGLRAGAEEADVEVSFEEVVAEAEEENAVEIVVEEPIQVEVTVKVEETGEAPAAEETQE